MCHIFASLNGHNPEPCPSERLSADSTRLKKKNFFLIMEESTRLKLLKSEEEKRTEFVNVRFTKNEIEMIETYVKKTKFSRSDLMRNLILNEIKIKKPLIHKDEIIPIADKDEIRLLMNIANNLNQIAKYSNQIKAFPNDNILGSIKEMLGNYLDKKL